MCFLLKALDVLYYHRAFQLGLKHDLSLRRITLVYPCPHSYVVYILGTYLGYVSINNDVSGTSRYNATIYTTPPFTYREFDPKNRSLLRFMRSNSCLIKFHVDPQMRP